MRHWRQLTLPPARERVCVLIALKWTVKEPSWYLGVFLWRNDGEEEKKRNTMNRIHQEECKKKKNQKNKSQKVKKVKLWEVEENAFAAFQWWGTVCRRGVQPLLPPFPRCVFTLWKYVYYYREYSYRENHFIKFNSYWLLFLYLLPLFSLFLFPLLVQSLVLGI